MPVRLSRTERKDVFQVLALAARQAETTDPAGMPLQAQLGDGLPPASKAGTSPGMISVLAVEVLQPVKLDEIFRSMVAAFPDLTWYDADIPIPLRYAAAFDVFPLAQVRLELRGGTILRITPLDTPWDLVCSYGAPSWPPVPASAADAAPVVSPQVEPGTGAAQAGEPGTDEPVPAPLRILSLEPDCDPAHARPGAIIISYPRAGTRMSPCAIACLWTTRPRCWSACAPTCAAMTRT